MAQSFPVIVFRRFAFVACVAVLSVVVVETNVEQNLAAAENAPRRSFVAADSSKSRIAIIDEDGKTAWEHKIGPLHDLHVLENGNLLFQDTWTHIVEFDPKKKNIVWEYEASKADGNVGKRLEVHAFQRIADGLTMVAESGRSRIVELDAAGKLVHQFALNVKQSDAHRDTRLVRRTPNGTYLVCHEGEGLVREYDRQGRTIWEYAVPMFDKQPAPGHGVEAFGNQCFSAIRLENGNTLIGTGNGHSVLEVNPDCEIVWSLHQNDLTGIQFAWITSLQVLPSGNILINNCHAGPSNPQLVEVTRDKEVVWTFNDFERFGDSLTNSQILTVDGQSVSRPVR
ncbi:MAG: PQQ-binding-like beta-propeller repeat protein [Planctomyces sp.]|nr:PQQ-binding-like beta-propeller repeat protein [Planctomyces sp.]